jgi:CheY-like chemotaxis protein
MFLGRVLLIDDNEPLAFLLGSLIETHGFDVRTAYTGEEGLIAAQDYRPDMICCDIGLPGISGFEVAETIRADEALKDTFMIAISGYTSWDYIEKARRAGFNEYLSKPVLNADLERVLGMAVRKPVHAYS